MMPGAVKSGDSGIGVRAETPIARFAACICDRRSVFYHSLVILGLIAAVDTCLEASVLEVYC